MPKGYVYILTNKRNGTLYVGVTKNPPRRNFEHKNYLMNGFCKKYGLHILVYIQEFERIDDAIKQEKRIKEWRRAWKLTLIEKNNPTWCDLSAEF